MNLFSFIIPVLNERAIIVEQLSALQVLREQGHEIILVDGGSNDNTVELARPYVDRVVESRPGRAIQMNAGCAKATRQYLAFLHIDTSLPIDISQQLQKFSNSNSNWGFFPVTLASKKLVFTVIAWFMNKRSRLSYIATGDQLLLVSNETFLGLGGYAPIALMEDVEICKRLRETASPWLADSKVCCDIRKWQKYGVMRTTLLMWSLRWAYFFGADPKDLHERYYGK